MRFGTRLINFDAAPGDRYQPMATPIYQTATFEQSHADATGEYDYSRSGNPTRKVLEDHLAALEGGTRGFCFASGMTAITAVTHLLRPGDEVVADWDLYGGTARLFGLLSRQTGVVVRYVDASDTAQLAAAISPKTRLIYVESPTNPLLRILDLSTIADIAQERGVLFCVDNSTLSPYLQNPLDLGADIVLHSATKFLSGHSDVTGGAIVVKDEELADRIYFLQNAEGAILSPFDSFLLLRGLKSLKIRIEEQQRNAGLVATFLSQHPKIRKVYYPGLALHPGYALHRKQARGAGSVLSVLVNSPSDAKAIAETTRLFRITVSFGSINSSVCIPNKMSHASVPAEIKEMRGITDSLLRFSIGIEDPEDLIEDLINCLKYL